jgi:hypothetical protein
MRRSLIPEALCAAGAHQQVLSIAFRRRLCGAC